MILGNLSMKSPKFLNSIMKAKGNHNSDLVKRRNHQLETEPASRSNLTRAARETILFCFTRSRKKAVPN